MVKITGGEGFLSERFTVGKMYEVEHFGGNAYKIPKDDLGEHLWFSSMWDTIYGYTYEIVDKEGLM
jgi:hypothetical protein